MSLMKNKTEFHDLERDKVKFFYLIKSKHEERERGIYSCRKSGKKRNINLSFFY